MKPSFSRHSSLILFLNKTLSYYRICCVVGISVEIGQEIEAPTQFVILHDVSGMCKETDRGKREVCFIGFLEWMAHALCNFGTLYEVHATE